MVRLRSHVQFGCSSFTFTFPQFAVTFTLVVPFTSFILQFPVPFALHFPFSFTPFLFYSLVQFLVGLRSRLYVPRSTFPVPVYVLVTFYILFYPSLHFAFVYVYTHVTTHTFYYVLHTFYSFVYTFAFTFTFPTRLVVPRLRFCTFTRSVPGCIYVLRHTLHVPAAHVCYILHLYSLRFGCLHVYVYVVVGLLFPVLLLVYVPTFYVPTYSSSLFQFAFHTFQLFYILFTFCILFYITFTFLHLFILQFVVYICFVYICWLLLHLLLRLFTVYVPVIYSSTPQLPYFTFICSYLLVLYVYVPTFTVYVYVPQFTFTFITVYISICLFLPAFTHSFYIFVYICVQLFTFCSCC